MGRSRAALSLLWSMAACSGEPQPKMDSSVLVDERGHVPDLICPGARGCKNADGDFFAGAGAAAITPEIGVAPVWIAGFGTGRAATGVHDDIWARALSFSRGEVRIGWVALDLVGVFHEEILRIRGGVTEFDQVIVVSTHNHEAPDTQGLWGPSRFESGYDPAYMELVIARAIEALDQAKANEQRASLEVARAEARHLVADSRMPEVIDPTITAAKLIAPDKRVFATFVIFGNHVEALGSDNTLITSDYPHYLRTRMENEFPGSISVFFPGTLGGLMNPLHIAGCPDAAGNETCPNGSFEKAEYIGEGVARLALAGFPTPIADNNPQLALRRKAILIPATNLGLALSVQLGLTQRTAYHVDGRPLLERELADLGPEDIMNRDVLFQTEVNALSLGPLEILMIPGELYPELWLAREDGRSFVEQPINADFASAPVDPPLSAFLPEGKIKAIVNEANDALGYIIPKSQFDLEAPYAYQNDAPYGESVSTGYETAPALVEATRAMYLLTVE